MAGCCDHDHDQTPVPKDTHAGHNHAGENCCSPAPVAFIPVIPKIAVVDGVQTSIRIIQMDCPTEEGLIRKKLGDMPTVKQLEFNLIQRVLTVTHAPGSLDSVLDAIRSLGFEPELPDASGQLAVAEAPKKPWWPLALAKPAVITSLGLPKKLLNGVVQTDRLGLGSNVRLARYLGSLGQNVQ